MPDQSREKKDRPREPGAPPSNSELGDLTSYRAGPQPEPPLAFRPGAAWSGHSKCVTDGSELGRGGEEMLQTPPG